jgi:glutamate-ammonia-ligase adenylyltransferase
VLTMHRDPEKLRADIASMRERMRREFGTQDVWSVKHLRGGLVDIEFIAQYLQLRHGADCPEILTGNTDATLAVARARGLIPRDMADDLATAAQLWRNLQGILRLTVEDGFSEATAPPALKTVIARACGMVDFATLKEKMSATAVRTAHHFKTLLGEADI